MTTAQIRAIERHGQQLLAIFPDATEKDPIELCRKLRRLEGQAAAFALRLCNGPEFESEEAQERVKDKIIGRVNSLLNNFEWDEQAKEFRMIVPVFLNQDPRGYALKIDDEWMREHSKATDHPNQSPTAVCRLHRDWGGYGILAPEIGKDGN